MVPHRPSRMNAMTTPAHALADRAPSERADRPAAPSRLDDAAALARLLGRVARLVLGLVRLRGSGRTGGLANGQRKRRDAAAWQQAARRRRLVFLGITLGVTALATALFGYLQPKQSHVLLQWGQLGLFALLSAWLVTGFTTALMGFWVSLRGDPHALTAASVRGDAMNPDARTAVIMPICNEDVATVFAGLRATCESLAATGSAAQFDVFVLSDSNQPATVAAERAAWDALRGALAAQTGDTSGRGLLSPAQAPRAPQGRQRRRLLPPLGQGLPLHGRAGRRQRDERRLPVRHGQADGSESARPASCRPRRSRSATSPCMPSPAVRLAHDRSPVHARHAVSGSSASRTTGATTRSFASSRSWRIARSPRSLARAA